MKIVFLADSISNQQAGIHYYGKQLIKSFVKQRPQEEYFVISSKTLCFENTKDIVVPLNGGSLNLRFRQILSIPKIVNNLNPDIVIELAHFGPFRLSKNIKRATVIHDLIPITHPQFHSKISVFFHKLLLPKIIHKADWIICNSNFTKTELIKNYKNSKGKIHVIYPEVPNYTNMEFEASSENIKPYFVSIGTIEPRKNYLNLILAFEDYKLKGGKNNLILIGPRGWLNKSFYATLKNLSFRENIIIKNSIPRNELLSILNYAKAFVSASWIEGFGLPLVESMAFSKPLILSNIQVYREIAEDAALYFNPNDIESISRALFKLDKNELMLIQKSKAQHKKLLATQRDFSFIS